MRRLIKSFSDGSFLEYDQGSIDDWCVYYTNKNRKRKAPKDVDYFDQLKQLADKYGADQVYDDFVQVYDLTGKQVKKSDLAAISQLADSYKEDALKVDVVFSILYMAMISEEQRPFTKLGKRIKRLGVHKLLMENCEVEKAANFMCGMDWQVIAKLCEKRGF